MDTVATNLQEFKLTKRNQTKILFYESLYFRKGKISVLSEVISIKSHQYDSLNMK